jgi:hypothetical protein
MSLIQKLVHRFVHEERAVSLTEFALVAPLLFIVIFGLIDFGRAINYWNAETQMAAQGARVAAVNGSDTYSGPCVYPSTQSASTLGDYIQCQADTNELRCGSSSVTKAAVQISLPGTSGAQGQPIKVAVSTQFNWMPLLSSGGRAGLIPLPNLSPTVTISGTATMRLERPWTSGAVSSSGPACP